MLADHAAQARVDDAESFSHQMQILMMGSMVSALRGDLDAAQRARRLEQLRVEFPPKPDLPACGVPLRHVLD
jgi:hypothetical protein